MTYPNSPIMAPAPAPISGLQFLADKVLCCAKWTSETGHGGRLTASDRVFCKAGYDHTNQAVLFRFYATAALKTFPDRKSSLYVFIEPQHISSLQHLSLDDNEATKECVRDLLVHCQQGPSSAEIIALRFRLKQPVTIIGQKEITSLEPRSAAAYGLLESLYSLSLATTLTLYLPKNESFKCIDELCARGSDGSLRPAPLVYSIPALYHGQGGKDIGALLDTFIASGETHQLPAYPDVVSTSTAQHDARPSERALGKRRRTDEDQEGPLPNRAWMQWIEQQLSDLGTSQALTQSKLDEMQEKMARSRSVAPVELPYTRRVTRSVSAHPEAATLVRLQDALNQVFSRVSALEQHQQEILTRLSALEQQQQELQQDQQELQQQQQQWRRHNTADETSSSTTGDVQVAQSSPAQPIEQQQHPQTSPRVPQMHPNSSQQTSSSQPPWSQLYDTREDDDDRLAAWREQQAGQSQQTQHSADSDEEHEAALAKDHHHHHHRNDAAAATTPPLFAELVALLGEARTLAGRHVHTHPLLRAKLEELGRATHAANVAAFDASRAWFRTLLYSHGPAAAADDRPLDPRRLLADVANLFGWAGERRRSCDLSVPPLPEDFMGLCAAATAADAEPPRALLAEYERLRDVCVARVLTLSGGRGKAR